MAVQPTNTENDIDIRAQVDVLKDQHRLLLAVLEHTHVKAAYFDPGFNYVWVNRAFADGCGQAACDLPGKNHFDLFPHEKNRSIFQKVLETGTPYSVEEDAYEFPDHPERGPTYWDWSLFPFKDAEKKIAGLVFTLSEVTGRRHAEEVLRGREARHRSILQTAMDGFWLADADGRLLEVNDAYCRMSGYGEPDLLRMSIPDLEASQTAEQVKSFLPELKDRGEIRFESRHRRKDGSLFDVEISAQYRPFEGGRIVSFIRDITRRKQMEAERERLMSAIEQASEDVVILDADEAIQYVNPCFEKNTGYARGEVIGKDSGMLRGMEGEAVADVGKTIKAGKTWRGKLVSRRKDGTLYTESASISPVLNESGAIINYVSVKRDITKELEIEKRMAQSQRIEAIGVLAGGIAHDFNNLLFPILGRSEILMEELPPESEAHDNIRQIKKAAQRAAELVKQILSFSSQAEHGRMPVGLQGIVKEVLKLIRSTIPSNIEITSEIQRDCGLIMADPTQLHQIIMNLVTNAYHAIEDTGGSISVRLEETSMDIGPEGKIPEHRKYAMLTVLDTGRGIDPLVMNRIFEPYFTTKPQGKGTGLGLSVVYGIVKAYGGDIRVASGAGKGAVFTVFLPVMSEQPEIIPPVPVAAYAGGHERILLVDDEEAVARLERELLERMGYRVTACTGSIAALEMFRSDPDGFDAVITDMSMPNMTGDRLAREMLSINPHIPIIICTGFSEKINEETAKSIGIRGFLLKPVVRSELARMVRMVLGGAGSDGDRRHRQN